MPPLVTTTTGGSHDPWRHVKVSMFGLSVGFGRHRFAASFIAILLVLWPLPAATQQKIEFRHVFDNSLLDVSPKPGEQFTEAVKAFHSTGQNPYNGKPEAIAEGKQLYIEFCQSCHMPDGSGGMGPSLIGDVHVYPRITTDVGLFDVVFGGGAGAMQPFSLRLSQDQILKVMAYVRTLMRK